MAYNSVSVEKNSNAVTTPKGLSDTREHSLSDTSVSVTVNASAPTREHSLAPAPSLVNDLDEDTSTTVYFTLDGQERVYEFATDNTDVFEAVEELNSYISAFGAKGKVVRVVVEFG